MKKSKGKNKELLLLRHGKSNWNVKASDFYRPLKKRGRENARQIAQFLKLQSLTPDVIFSSTATRALDTAKIICDSLNLSRTKVSPIEHLYLADLNELLKTVQDVDYAAKRIMIVGHNPGLEDLLKYYVPNITIPSDGKLLATATLVHLQLDQEFTKLTGSYMIQRPSDLKL